MLGSPAGPGGPQRGLWPLAPAPAPSATSFTADGFGKYGVYSLFPGGPSFGSALYSHVGRFAAGHIQHSSGNSFHTAHKVSDSLFSSTGYMFGAPTPPPGSPYSPIPVTQLELLSKGFNSNIIIQQPEYPQSPKKIQIQEKRCDEKCCSLKPQKTCNCQDSPVKTKYGETGNGCSRTNPIEWGGVNVKKEPGSTPCQVAEITTSVSPVIKLEVTSPTQKNLDGHHNIINSNSMVANGNNIPVGIAVARQRVQHEVISSPTLPPTGLLTTVNTGAQFKEIARISEIDSTGGVQQSSMAAVAAEGGVGGGTLLQCTDDRTSSMAGWQMGGSHSSSLATPTLWQYPASVPMEPMVPLPVPMHPVLVRDPTTGSLLLLPTTEPLQQALVWPSYPQPSSVLLPSLPPMPSLPPPPLQLLSSASSDYLQSSTTLHQHTQTHSTRLVALTTDTKRKIPLPIPATTLIKIETDATSMDQTKTLQAVSTIASNTGTVYTDQNMTPLVTTHVIYQHPTNLILSQTPTTESTCRSQATSPVTCLTPPPDTVQPHEEVQEAPLAVQDASNQTDSPICSEDDNTAQTLSDVVPEPKTKPEEEVVDNNKLEQVEAYREDNNNIVPEVDVVKDQVGEPKIMEVVEEVTKSKEHVEELRQDVSEEVMVPKPDISGLELLSNSIVEFESCRNTSSSNESEEPIVATKPSVQGVEVLSKIANMTLKDCDKDVIPSNNNVEDSLGGLDLLCALAEQRILEENSSGITVKEKTDKEKSRERRREKRKSKRHSEEPKRKKSKSDKHYGDENRTHKKHKNRDYSDTNKSSDKYGDNNDEKHSCSCNREGSYRTYKTPESEVEVRKFIASKSQSSCCKGDWPCMNAMELDMRMKLADLQRQYREKQKELSKLKPKKHSSECSKKRSRKKSTQSTTSCTSDRSLTPPPLLDKMDTPIKPIRSSQDLLKPPTLCPYESIKKPDNVVKLENNHHHKRQLSPDSVDSSPEKSSSSKKRKVGRPKKLLSSPGLQVTTETIVAKKPKNSFVGYLLAAKEKYQMNNKLYADSPPRYVEESPKPKKNKNNNNIEDIKSSKMRPKLKAEATVKTYIDDDLNEEEEIEDGGGDDQMVDSTKLDFGDEEEEDLVEEEEEDEDDKTVESEMEEEVDDKNDAHEEVEKVVKETKIEEEIVEDVKPDDSRCTLTAAHLETDKLRVLTAMGGLFYAGHLNAVEPPDVYSITLDGERGNRPHIMSREEILRDAIVEVSARSTSDLPVGTRLCAYWSQQYRCLYPGSVAEPGSPHPELDEKFVAVEFDDGDSGRIALEDIRLLPPDYPIIEYDPNPLLSLSKRRRRTSTSISTEERRPSQDPHKSPKDTDTEKENKDINKPDTTIYKDKEKKRLKKKKREKLKQKLLHEDKKKKKKHKCEDENCKHKKHKKHRKHKKHHDKERVEEEEDEEEEKQGEETIEEVEELEEENKEEGEDEEEISEKEDKFDEDFVVNPDDEVTMDDIIEATKSKKSKKIRDRQESCESRSKMSAFLPARQLWGWSGKGYKRQRAKGRSKKSFYKSIQRGKESITVGDSAVFLSTGRPDRPYIGRIEAMWELCGTMVVKVKWFYHPEETVGCPLNLQYPGALFESPHVDENDVQTISHKCEVLPLKEYTERLGDDPARYAMIYDNNDIYYLAGYYDPTSTSLKMEPGIPFSKMD